MPTFHPIQYGKFLLLDRIAHGGMAELYRAKIIGSKGFEKLVAIKKILPHLADQDEFVSAFIDEARLAAFLQHRNIVQIFDFGEMAGSYFLSMEYLSGLPLRSLMNRAGKNEITTPLAIALYIVTEICAGLHYAHNLKNFAGEPLNIIHRDIGPQNIFITYDGQIKIIDFGIARATSHNSATDTGSLKGKLAYMSPEQAGCREIDHRSDIFSAGIILYELVTRTHLYTGDSHQLLALAASGTYKPAQQITTELPSLLYEILARALCLDPEQRYQSAEEMRRDLERCATESVQLGTARELAGFVEKLFAEEAAREKEALKAASCVELPPADEMLGSEASQFEETLFIPQDQHSQKQKRSFRLPAALLASILTIALFLIFSFQRQSPLKDDGTGIWIESSTDQRQQEKKQVDPYLRARMYFSRLLAAQNNGTDLPAEDLAELDNQTASLMDKFPEEAHAFLSRLAEKYPGTARVHFQYGRVQMLRKEEKKALAAYRKATALDPQMADAFFNLGYLYAEKKEYTEARKMYLQVIPLNTPYEDEALFNLAVIEKQLGMTSESMAHAKMALDKNPNNRQAAKLIERLGQPNIKK